MRLNKFLANCGVGSRRKCDELIESGQIKVNDAIATLGQEISENDKVYYNNALVNLKDEKYYYILNKPKGCITTMQDDRGRTTVIDVFNDAYRTLQGKNAVIPNVFPVGRLDYNTQGLLIMTNDGDFANSLMHPKRKVPKTYVALVYPHITPENVEKLQNGVVIDGVKTLPSVVKILKTQAKKQWIQITITQGRNRQIRKMIESVGSKVNELERIKVGEVALNDLERGQIRAMSKVEITQLLAQN